MRQLLIYGLLILGCLTACKREADTVVPADSKVPNDTIYNISRVPYVDSLFQKKDTIVIIDSKKYVLTCEAKMDTLDKVSYSYISTEKGKIQKSVFKGYNIRYAISIEDSTGKKRVFEVFTKHDFKNVADPESLAYTSIYLPRFEGYHKGFNAFLFTLDFFIPDSDVGDQCFIMINRNGKVIEKSINNYYGGGGSDSSIEIPTNHKFILTGNKILNTTGKIIDLEDSENLLVCTRLINDTTILFIRDYKDGRKDNAQLIDNQGNVLKTFTYKGYYDMLGYVVPSYFEKITGNYLLFDEQQQEIRVINKDNPINTFSVPFGKLKASDKTATEVLFTIETETNKNTFAIDTINKAIRLVSKE